MKDSDFKFMGPLQCPHCSNKTRQKIIANYSQVESHEDSRSGVSWDAGPIWKLALCPACSSVSLLRFDFHDGFEPDEWKISIVFPSLEKVPIGLPIEVGRAYQAAQKVRDIDSNAFAVILGRVIDIICIDKGAKGDSLYRRLTSLAESGEIPGRLAEMAHQLRQLRNIGAHADLGDLTPDEVPVLDALCNAVLEYVYTVPQLIEQVEQRLQVLKGEH
jgi:Domain of unknown function (DUF4145)